MRECGILCSPPALYKGARWGLGRPAQRIKAREEQGVGAIPLPLLATAQFPASTVRAPKRMGAVWRGCRTEATDDAASPHPVIVGGGAADASKTAHRPRLVNAPRPHAYLHLGRRA